MTTSISWLIGSNPDCDIVVAGSKVSGSHARLTKRPDGFHYLEDLGSAHGTFVEGVRISEPCRVTPKDTITIGPKAVLAWPKAPPSQPKATTPVAEKPSRGSPLLYAAVAAAFLVVGVALGAFLVPQFLPNAFLSTSENQEGGEASNANVPQRDEKKPKEGFKMGALQPNEPIKSIKVTLDVDMNGEPLRESVDLHLGFGFPLRLYPVGSDSREPAFAAFPQKSSLKPGSNSIDSGGRAWFEFLADPEEPGLDELKTTPTLLSKLTTSDIHSIGFASRGESEWILEGYKIEINGNLFASNDSVFGSAEELQSQNEVEMLSRQAEIDALESQVEDQREIVESGLASDSDKAELQLIEADLKLMKERLNTNIGLVSGYYPWFQESSTEFKPASSTDEQVKSIVVTLVPSAEQNSGTLNSLYLAAGPQKHLLSAASQPFEEDSQKEQVFELDSVSLKNDPITKSQISDFAIGMLGNDLPFAEIPDRAKFQRVSLEVDGEIVFNSEQKEVDRDTLAAVYLVPPVHQNSAGALVENTETATQLYRWAPGMKVEAGAGSSGGAVVTNNNTVVIEPPITERGTRSTRKDPRRIISPSRNPNNSPNVYVIMVPGRTGSTQPWGGSGGSNFGPGGSRTSPFLGSSAGRGPVSPWSSWPIAIIPPPPQRPPVISNVRIATPGLLRDGQRPLVTWNVTGNTSQIRGYRVTLNPVLPHTNVVLTQNVGVQTLTTPTNPAAPSTTVRIALNSFAPSGGGGLSAQRKYLYVEPQVTALLSPSGLGSPPNVSAKGPIVPVSPNTPPPAVGSFGRNSVPTGLTPGPLSTQARVMTLSNPLWTAVPPISCPGYQQFGGDGFGFASPNSISDRWRAFTPGDLGNGACVWRLTNPSLSQPSFPLKIATFGTTSANEPNLGTSSWGIPPTTARGNWTVVRYEAFNVPLTTNMHVVAHLGFINGPPTANNTATVSAQVVVQNGPPWSVVTGSTSSTEVLRINTPRPWITFNKLNGATTPNPLQLIDIPIQLNTTAAAYAAPLTLANSNCGIPSTTSLPAVTVTPTGFPTPTRINNAYVSVTLFINQTRQNVGGTGSEGVGVFGVRLVPDN